MFVRAEDNQELLMGVWYCRYLIPQDNTIRPQPDLIATLIEAWLENRYVIRPAASNLPGGHGRK
jgi:hypothetical protein